MNAMQALEMGNNRRMVLVSYRRRMEGLSMCEGLEEAAKLLRHFDDDHGAMKLDYLLCSVRWFGDHKVRQLLRSTPEIDPNRRYTRLRDLTSRERAALILGLRRRIEEVTTRKGWGA